MKRDVIKMSKGHSEAMAELRACEQQPDGDHAKRLQVALRHPSSLVVQRAANICCDQGLDELTDDLLDAYPRFLKKPSKSDNGCVAKKSIVQALWKLGYDDHDFYLAGIRYVQLDPVFGPPVDSAAELRVMCGYALLENGYPHVMRELVDLLADPEKAARAGAIRAMAGAGRPESAWLLRMKLHVGDAEPEVMGECFSALLQIAPGDSLSLITTILIDQNASLDLRLEAAVALGESRRAEAVEPLLGFARSLPDPTARPIVFSALGIVRQPKAVEFLMAQIRPDQVAVATAAIQALTYAADQASIRQRVWAVAKATDSAEICAVVEKAFPKPDG